MPTYSITANTSIPHQIKVEEYLGIRFTKCRDIHFYESQTLSLGDYTTLISFEVPTESLILLLEQSSKLPSYGEFTRNARHFTFLEQVVKDIDWWKPAQLKNAVSSIKSWCSKYEGGKCFLYGNAVVAFAKVESSWVRIYICCQIEMLPVLVE